MRKIFRKLHIWISLPFGLVISIICLTGAALIFETEILELCYPSRYFCKQTAEKPMPLDKLLENVSYQLNDSVKITTIQVYSNPSRNYRLTLSGSTRTYFYVNPYTATIQDYYTFTDNFFSTTLRLHRWLLDYPQKKSIGKTIVGISTILFIFSIITGIITWLPRKKQKLSNSLHIPFNLGRKRLYYGLHVVGGVYASLILLLLAITGLTWSFSWYRTPFYKLLGVDLKANVTQLAKNKTTPESNKFSKPSFTAWYSAYNQLSQKCPNYKSITLQNGKANLHPNLIFGNTRANDQYEFDQQTGEITSELRFENKDKETRMRSWVYCLHIGSWGGLLSKTIMFLAALLGATLPLTGYYFYFRKIYRRKRR